MQHIKRILVAMDLSEEPAKAVQRAGMLSEDLRCWMVEMLTVEEDGFGDAVPCGFSSKFGKLGKFGEIAGKIAAARNARAEWMRAKLNLTAETLQSHFRIRCNPSIRFGQPAFEILNRGDEIKADLVVIGAHGNGSADNYFIGSNADKLMCMATRPVLLVKNQPARPYQDVLIPVDFSSDAMRAAQIALQLAPHAHITFLHAFRIPYDEPTPGMDACQRVIDEQRREAMHETERRLDEFIAALAPQTNRIARVVRYGAPTDVVIRYAGDKRPDLIAVGKHGGSALPQLLLGSVARRTLTHSLCDVVVATAGGNAAQWQGPHAA